MSCKLLQERQTTTVHERGAVNTALCCLEFLVAWALVDQRSTFSSILSVGPLSIYSAHLGYSPFLLARHSLLFLDLAVAQRYAGMIAPP